MRIQDRTVEMYRLNQSIKETARELQLSEALVRRYLIDAGEYTTDRIEMIRSLYNKGKSVREICSLLHLSKSAVSSVIPYTKGSYKNPPSRNAIRIKKCRERKNSHEV